MTDQSQPRTDGATRTDPRDADGDGDGGRSESGFVSYGIDDRPPLPESAVLGVQHYLTMIGANIAIPLALAGAMGMPAWATARLVGTFFVVSGAATLLQTTLGNRYPIVQGGTFSMLAPALAIITVLQGQNAGWQVTIRELQGAVIVAGLVQVVIGYSGLMGRLKRHIGPIVIAPVIVLIGLSLFNVPQLTNPNFGAPGTGQNWWLLLGTAGLIVLCSQYLDAKHPAFKLYPVIIGVGLTWGVAAVLSSVGVIDAGTTAYVDLSAATSGPAFQPITPFQWGMPLFTPGFMAGMFAGMLASVIESFGDYHSVARIAGEGAPNAERVDNGIGMEGIGNAFAGVMGTGNGSTSYTENVGAIAITSVASRYVVQIGAVVMLAAGFFGPFGQLVTTIPSPIVGGLYLVMFGQIAAVGLSQLEHVDLGENRNVFIVGIALFAGLAIPAYMGNVGQGMEAGGAAALAQGLGTVPVVGSVLGTDAVAQTVFVIGNTGMAVGGLVAFFLDTTIPGSRDERGLTAWERVTEPADAFVSPFDRLRQFTASQSGDDRAAD